MDINTLQLLYPLVSEQTLCRLKSYHFIQDALLCALGELLTKYAISEAFGMPIEGMCFLTTDYGKPYLLGHNQIHFNRSHAGEKIVCAVSDQPIGIDIEKISPLDVSELSKNCYTQEECHYLSQLSEQMMVRGFFELWTAKESYIKLVGKGLSIPLDSFTIRKLVTSATAHCAITGEILAYVHYHDLDPLYKLALCTQSPVACSSVTHVNFNPSALNISSLCASNTGGASMALSSIFSK